MAVKIYPSVLASTRRKFQQRLTLVRSLRRPVHVDVMDGRFVRTRSIGPQQLAKFSIPSQHELHLMVKHPERWLNCALQLRTPVVIIPVELGQQLEKVIALFRSHRIQVVLSINPGTAVQRLKPWLRFTRRVHVMTVHPGRYGARFQSSAIRTVQHLHRRHPTLIISCDGGLDATTIPLVRLAGAQIMVVGSYIVLDRHPRAALKTLERLSRASKT